jgi:hypothetical protein
VVFSTGFFKHGWQEYKLVQPRKTTSTKEIGTTTLENSLVQFYEVKVTHPTNQQFLS